MRVTLDSCRCQELLQNEHKLSSPSRNCDPPTKKMDHKYCNQCHTFDQIYILTIHHIKSIMQHKNKVHIVFNISSFKILIVMFHYI